MSLSHIELNGDYLFSKSKSSRLLKGFRKNDSTPIALLNMIEK